MALRRLTRSFDELEPTGRPASRARERSLLRLARQLGTTAVPSCVRELGGDDGARAEWAYTLLAHIAEGDGDRPRVTQALSELASNRASRDQGVLRALALLDELGEALPSGATLSDPEAAWKRSVEELVACLSLPEEAARVADGLVTYATEDHIAELLRGLESTERRAAAALLAEISARHELDEPFRLELGRRAAWLPRGASPKRPDVAIRVGRSETRAVVIASSPPKGRWVRALCALIDEGGRLLHTHFAERISRQALERDVVAPLEREGHAFVEASAASAAGLLSRAARLAVATRGALPREYYLGRHLLGLADEHVVAPELGPRERARSLARARELLSRGAAGRARLLLEGFVEREPRDADARATLGLCVLALGEPAEAHRQLERAVELDPDQPAHLWNLASAAHREGRPGACYLALLRFLDGERFGALVDDSVEERRRRARAYVREYERLARLEHPGSDAPTLARAEALYCEARLTLARGDAIATIRALREVVERVPTHYAAWTHLGMAQGVSGRLDDARASLERALALRPGDPLARDTMRSLDLPLPENAKRG